MLGVRAVLRRVMRGLVQGERARQARFWIHQALNLLASLVVVFGLMSIWFDDPARLATAIGLFSAGLAFALQRVVTAFAGYIVILRGNNFTVGDRISMGGVRGDVLALGFIQTTLMEMGVAPGSDAGPSVWVKSRQFTGRIVTVSNAKIFEEPVYNYTRDFPFIWEEMSVTVRYEDDRSAVERIVLEAARRHAVDPAEISAEAARTLERRFELQRLDFEPRVFYRLTSNWLEMNLRFMSRDHGTRVIKDPHRTRRARRARPRRHPRGLRALPRGGDAALAASCRAPGTTGARSRNGGVESPAATRAGAAADLHDVPPRSAAALAGEEGPQFGHHRAERMAGHRGPVGLRAVRPRPARSASPRRAGGRRAARPPSPSRP